MTHKNKNKKSLWCLSNVVNRVQHPTGTVNPGGLLAERETVQEKTEVSGVKPDRFTGNTNLTFKVKQKEKWIMK